MRLIDRADEFYRGCTAGQWLVPGQGLAVHYDPHLRAWRVTCSIWLDRHHLTSGPELRATRTPWLERHGLDQACFTRRRDAVAAAAYALHRDPLPQLVGEEVA